MLLSDVSVKRPVFATVINLLLIIFGIVAISMLSLREYPDIDPPIVSVSTNYTGASANIVETRITLIIADCKIFSILKEINKSNLNSIARLLGGMISQAIAISVFT